MAAYQCLNCEEIERSGVDCCNTPDLCAINDMPGLIKRLLKFQKDVFEIHPNIDLDIELLSKRRI